MHDESRRGSTAPCGYQVVTLELANSGILVDKIMLLDVIDGVMGN